RADIQTAGTCGGANITIPFTDVPSSNIFFCAIASAYFSGLTNGTSATTYSPSDPVPREQMAAFITRTLDQSLKRGSRRAALNQYWTTRGANNLALTTVGLGPRLVQSDGADVWVANLDGAVSRVRASDGKLLGTGTGATSATGVLCAMGKVFITGSTSPGSLYQIDPTQPPGAVTTVSNSLGNLSRGIAYDGERIWTANLDSPGSVSIVTLNPTSVTTVSTGFISPVGFIYDGANIWVTDNIGFGSVGKLHMLNPSGAIVLSVDVGDFPQYPAFDGTNIWVPNLASNTVSVVRAVGPLAGTVLATLGGAGLDAPVVAAFDGERILVTNSNGSSVSLWKASDLTPIGTFSVPASSGLFGACSDGLNFWVTLGGINKLARF
ncbi:MAG TPA: S-layer homology domain-containing protein, partial [Blastocatellia bacterium]|nr:S-layer homology domain-containing protein [Blastocatellia bacterium]